MIKNEKKQTKYLLTFKTIRTMKMRKFFALVLTGALFAACSTDDMVEVDNGVITTGEKDAWVYLNIVTANGSMTRNLNGTENGTDKESKVTGVMAIFFDGHVDDHGTNVSAANPNVVNVGTMTLGTPGQPSGAQGAAFEIDKTAKSILVIINPTAKFKAQINSKTTFAEINAAIAEDIADVAKDDNFMMTNAKGALEPSDADGVGEALKTYSTAGAAEGAPLTIKVDRVAAKIRVYNDAGGQATAQYPLKIADFGWVENATNKKYFPISQRIATWNENSGNTGALGTFRAPYDQYKIGSYRVDPNYIAEKNSNAFTTAAYTDEYNAIADGGAIADATWSNGGNAGTWRGHAASAYCLENTQVAEKNSHAWTTHVIVKAKVYPKTIPSGPTTQNSSDGDYTSDAQLDGTQDLIAYGSGIYTYETYLNFVYEELVGYFMSPAESSYSTPFTDALNAFLAGNAVTIIGTRGELQPEAMVTAKGFKSTFAGKTLAAGTVGTFKYYAASTSYYKIMIKHDDTTAAMNALGEFGVVRNSVYDVHIGSISNLGYPEIPGPDETKDEEDKAWLSVKIDINPWTWYTQTEHL